MVATAVLGVTSLKRQREEGAPALLVDVRSASEFGTGHIPGAINIPLEPIEARMEDLGQNLPVVLICKGGTRARMTAGLLMPCRQDVTVLEGARMRGSRPGLPVVASVQTRWSLERQVRLVAGLIVLNASVLGLAFSVRWFYLAGFVGLGLSMAGLTDFCPMGVLLSKMPWNGARHCGNAAADAKTASCCE
jgi:rhodanese-related sulfurtransferase